MNWDLQLQTSIAPDWLWFAFALFGDFAQTAQDLFGDPFNTD